MLKALYFPSNSLKLHFDIASMLWCDYPSPSGIIKREGFMAALGETMDAGGRINFQHAISNFY